MRNPSLITGLKIVLMTLLILMFSYCSTGIDASPDPGILRVTLQSDPADTMIVIVKDTIFTQPGDSMHAVIFQGKAYSDSVYSVLFQNRQEYFPRDHNYNLLKQSGGDYSEFVIFESLVPPQDYTHIQFGIRSNYLLLTYGYAVGGIEIPVTKPADESSLQDLYYNFSVKENKVTEINLRIKPIQSVSRYRDVYIFKPQIEIVSVRDAGAF